MKLYPVILSGGSGTRLWPLSREKYPKQLLSLMGEETLLQQTVSRLEGIDHVAAPLVVCNEAHRFLIAEQLAAIGTEPRDIILEPLARNTAPALTLAALALTRDESDALMLVLPADHLIRDPAAFRQAIREGTALAKRGKLVTFGVVPTVSATGYGYIKRGDGSAVAAFVEKPDQKTAEGYLASGGYLWNSGIFLLRAAAWLAELKQHAPAMLAACEKAFAAGVRDGAFYRIDPDAFARCPSDSIDYAVMEKTREAAVVPLAAGWSDIGAFSSLWEESARDDAGNVIHGDVMAHETTNALLIAGHRLLAAVGLDDLIVIETADAVLVARKDRAQDVSAIVRTLKERRRAEYEVHRRVYRPWGWYEGVDQGPRFQVKRLMVKPGALLSLQRHHHRAEHWVVVSGAASVVRGDETFVLAENESTYIPVGTVHRLGNPGKIPLEVIEVQSGSYLGEDDIARLEDTYGRT